MFTDGLLTKSGIDGYSGNTNETENFTYTTYRGRIKMSGPIEIVASYHYRDGELRFTDFSFPNCSPVDECLDKSGKLVPTGYYASFGLFPTPWVRQN